MWQGIKKKTKQKRYLKINWGNEKWLENKKDKIVRVQFAENHVMMFGNSYKAWEEQLDEYLWLLKRDGELHSVKG